MGAAAVSYLRSMLAELTSGGLSADVLKSATTLDLADPQVSTRRDHRVMTCCQLIVLELTAYRDLRSLLY